MKSRIEQTLVFNITFEINGVTSKYVIDAKIPIEEEFEIKNIDIYHVETVYETKRKLIRFPNNEIKHTNRKVIK